MMRNDNCGCTDNTLLLEIQKISFAIDDLRLYIDTHPDCSEAIVLFNEYAEKRNELVCRYNSEIMPLSGYTAEQSGKWRWGRAGMMVQGGER